VVAVCGRRAELGDAVLTVVTFADDPGRLAVYREHLGLDVPVVADVDRVLYGMLGVGRGSLRRVWSPGTLAMSGRLLRRGRRLRRPSEDTRQLGADLVVDRDGVVRALWLPEGPDRRPAVDEIVAAVRRLGPV
jgi:hypothetical protein